ncbi:MAG TPA: hypothetical protein DD413_08920 [Ruminococcus sp.]|nr:hypothetical protein [Ruminococcus sp.]
MTSRLIANGNQEKRHLKIGFWDVWKPSPTHNFIKTLIVVIPTFIIEPYFIELLREADASLNLLAL